MNILYYIWMIFFFIICCIYPGLYKESASEYPYLITIGSFFFEITILVIIVIGLAELWKHDFQNKNNVVDQKEIFFKIYNNTLHLLISFFVIVSALIINPFRFMPNLLFGFLTDDVLSAVIMELEYVFASLEVLSIFAYTFSWNPYVILFKMLIILTVIIILYASTNHFERRTHTFVELPIIVLLAVFFLFTLVSANDLMIAFISVIGFSLNLYVLILYDQKNHNSREAAIKYYYLSAFSSGLIAFGILLAYLMFLTTNFIDIQWILSNWDYCNNTSLLSTMIFFISFGFFFKLAAFPCHLWAAAVYEGSPLPIMAFFILPVKIAVLTFVFKLFIFTFKDLYFIWSFIIWFSAICSMLFGALAALVEKKIKKFFAYSSINQIGFLLIGLVGGTPLTIQSSVIYLIIYVIMNIMLFIILLNIFEKKTYRPLVYLTDFIYYSKTNLLKIFPLVVILFSMAGIPPLAGFFGKYYLFLNAFSQQLYFLVVVGMFTSMISTFYYLKIIKFLVFDNCHDVNILFVGVFRRPLQMVLNVCSVILILSIFVSPLYFDIINMFLIKKW